MSEKYSLKIQLDGLPRMVNKSFASHWKSRMTESRKWKMKIFKACCNSRPSKPLAKAKLVLTRFSSRSPDFDGLVSGFKHCIDGLKEAGIILDDKFDNIGQPEYKWEKVGPRNGKVIIEVYEP